MEPLRLRFREEFGLPERRHNTCNCCTFTGADGKLQLAVSAPLAGDRDMLELKLDTDDEDEDVFFLLL